MAVQYFTPVQASAHRILAHAIARVQDQGQVVPCQTNPAYWDDSSSDPGLCDGCPVMRQCAAYADTGAVEHGVIAGRRLRRRPDKNRSAAAA